MRSRLPRLLTLVLCVTLLCFEATPSHATNINLGPMGCQAFLPQDAASLVHFGNTLTNLYGTTTFPVVCSVPHQPLAVGLDAAWFVDGSAGITAPISCSLASYNFNGEFLGSADFSTTSLTFDQYLSLPAAQVPYWAYTQLWCQLPPGAALFGVTVIQ